MKNFTFTPPRLFWSFLMPIYFAACYHSACTSCLGFYFVCTLCKIRPVSPRSVLMLSLQEKFQVNLVIKQQSGDKNHQQPLHARDKLCAVPVGFPVILHHSVWNSSFLLMITVGKCEIYHMHYLLPHPGLAVVLFASVDSLYVALMGEVPRLSSTR